MVILIFFFWEEWKSKKHTYLLVFFVGKMHAKIQHIKGSNNCVSCDRKERETYGDWSIMTCHKAVRGITFTCLRGDWTSSVHYNLMLRCPLIGLIHTLVCLISSWHAVTHVLKSFYIDIFLQKETQSPWLVLEMKKSYKEQGIFVHLEIEKGRRSNSSAFVSIVLRRIWQCMV